MQNVKKCQNFKNFLQFCVTFREVCCIFSKHEKSWCMLNPAGQYEHFSFFPVAIGLLLGSGFVLTVGAIFGKIGGNNSQQDPTIDQSKSKTNDSEMEAMKYNLVEECSTNTPPEITTKGGYFSLTNQEK